MNEDSLAANNAIIIFMYIIFAAKYIYGSFYRNCTFSCHRALNMYLLHLPICKIAWIVKWFIFYLIMISFWVRKVLI